jgi:Ca2+-binding EF-hand superfamily protein
MQASQHSEKFDTNRNKMITLEEMSPLFQRQLFKHHGATPEDMTHHQNDLQVRYQKFRNTFKLYDSNDDGSLDRLEIMRFVLPDHNDVAGLKAELFAQELTNVRDMDHEEHGDGTPMDFTKESMRNPSRYSHLADGEFYANLRKPSGGGMHMEL